MSARQRVLIVDDHPLFRAGLVQLVEMAGDEFEVVGQASGGVEGIALAEALRPDIVLLDLNMTDMSGIEVIGGLVALDLDARILMLTVSDAAEDLLNALRSGADGYLLKDMDPAELLAGIRQVAQGVTVLGDKLTGLLVHAIREDSRPASVEDAGLTEQERRILNEVAAGKTNKAIARSLDISDGTVKVHVKHILRKLKLRSRTEAAVWALERAPRDP